MTNQSAADYVPAEHWELAVAEALLDAIPPDFDGTALVAPSGIGVFARVLAERAPGARRVMFASADADDLDRVRRALDGLDTPAFFAQQGFEDMAYAPGVFGAAFSIHGLVDAASFRNRASDLERLVDAGGLIGLAVVGSGSLSTLTDLLVEELWQQDPQRVDELRDYAARRLDADAVDVALAPLELEPVASGTSVVPVTVTPERLLADPLLRDALVPYWAGFGPTVWEGAAERFRTYFDGQRLVDRIDVHWRLLRVPILDVADDLIEDIGNAAQSGPVP